MTPGAQMTFAVIAAGVGLSGVVFTLVKAAGWMIKRLMAEHVAPFVKEFTAASRDLGEKMSVMGAMFAASQRSQDRSNVEMHDAVKAIREHLHQHDVQIAEHSTQIAVLQQQTGATP